MSDPISRKQIHTVQFTQHEEGIRHQTAEEEQIPYRLLQAGDLRAVDVMQEIMQSHSKSMRTSRDPLRNQRYLFVAAVTLAGRAAIAAGMDAETSNIASDLFIQKMDQMKTIQEIQDYAAEMIRYYTLEVASLERKRKHYTRPVSRGLDYIDTHLHESIPVADVVRESGVSRSYLAALFKEETGLGIAETIRSKKLETACNLLRTSDLSVAEISETLAFSSQSHFIQVFRQAYGVTPHKYRNTEA